MHQRVIVLNQALTQRGPQGVSAGAGAQGPQGPQGISAEVGAQGPQGDVGSRGPQGGAGSQGSQGVQGVQGGAGPQGSQGVRGPQGDAGPQGSQGVQGVQGDAGPQGAQGVQGVQGDAGPQGAQGGQGGAGSQGPQGVQGGVGAQGPQGEQGAAGPQGVQGPQGALGVQGEQGPQGDVGEQGPQGTQGVQGPQGDVGAQGSQGALGVQGDVGPQGPQGIASSFTLPFASGSPVTYVVTLAPSVITGATVAFGNSTSGVDFSGPAIATDAILNMAFVATRNGDATYLSAVFGATTAQTVPVGQSLVIAVQLYQEVSDNVFTGFGPSFIMSTAVDVTPGTVLRGSGVGPFALVQDRRYVLATFLASTSFAVNLSGYLSAGLEIQ